MQEMSMPIFWEKIRKKYFKMSSAKIFTQHAKHLPEKGRKRAKASGGEVKRKAGG